MAAPFLEQRLEIINTQRVNRGSSVKWLNTQEFGALINSFARSA